MKLKGIQYRWRPDGIVTLEGVIHLNCGRNRGRRPAAVK